MANEIEFAFIDVNTGQDLAKENGAVFADYFRDNGLDRAVAIAHEPVGAAAVLRATYLGACADNLGVTWKIWDEVAGVHRSAAELEV